MMRFDQSLNFKRVLICRPEPEALALAQALKEKGIISFVFPTLVIQSLHSRAAFDATLSSRSESNACIFVSPNAVKQAFTLMTSAQVQWCQASVCFAVGPSTHQALKEQGVLQVMTPESMSNSEALLALQELQLVQGRHFFLFSGQEGRDLIEKTLTARGALVQKVVSYESVCPRVDPSPLIQAWQQQPFDCVVVTSQRMLENLFQLLSGHQGLLQATTITVMSERTKAWAMAHGITRWIEVQDASIAGLLRCLTF